MQKVFTINAEALNIFLLALVLGVSLPLFLNKSIFNKFGKNIYEYVIKNDDLEKLFYKSASQTLLISITLANGKVYVGYVLRGIDPESIHRFLKILPLISGYRDDKKMISFTNNYESMYQNIQDNIFDEFIGDLAIVIPYDEIRSANLFAMERYENVNNSTAEVKE